MINKFQIENRISKEEKNLANSNFDNFSLVKLNKVIDYIDSEQSTSVESTVETILKISEDSNSAEKIFIYRLIKLFIQKSELSKKLKDTDVKVIFNIIEGGSGVGKSTLIESLKDSDVLIVQDDITKNIFIPMTKEHINNPSIPLMCQLGFRLPKLEVMYGILLDEKTCNSVYVDSWFITEDAHIRYFLLTGKLLKEHADLLERIKVSFIKPLIKYSKFTILDASIPELKKRIFKRSRSYEIEDTALGMQISISKELKKLAKEFETVTNIRFIDTSKIAPNEVLNIYRE